MYFPNQYDYKDSSTLCPWIELGIHGNYVRVPKKSTSTIYGWLIPTYYHKTNWVAHILDIY